MVKSGEKYMFIGLYQRSLEAKGRLAVPQPFRKQFDNGAIITRGLDGCLFLFTKNKWSQIAGKLSNTPLTSNDARAFVRLLSYEAFEVSFDSQGRILIPEVLKKFAQLKRKIIIAGSVERIEIWDEEQFEHYQTEIEKSSNQIAERLANLEIKI